MADKIAEFKYILCLGSTYRYDVEVETTETFKYILCLGSTLFLQIGQV